MSELTQHEKNVIRCCEDIDDVLSRSGVTVFEAIGILESVKGKCMEMFKHDLRSSNPMPGHG